MIVAVAEQYHDYELRMFMLNTNKLNPESYVDAQVLNAIKESKESCIRVFINASRWEDNPRFNNSEPNITESAKVEKGPAERLIYLVIDFDC